MNSVSVPAGGLRFQGIAARQRTSGRAGRRETGETREAGELALSTARRGWYGLRRLWWRPVWHLRASGVEHLPRRGGFLLCGNHASHLDAPAILAALPREVALRATTAAARDVFGGRWWRRLAARLTTNALTLQREADFAGGLRALEAVLNDGRPLVLFPEGKRGTSGELLPFKLGAAMLALRTGAPIVPVRLTGCDDALPKGSSVPAPADVSVRFGEPISPAAYQQAIADGQMTRREAYERLTAELREAIETMGR
jgi:1-acyl-sn-glycerol-3-phosphate acyltransferase